MGIGDVFRKIFKRNNDQFLDDITDSNQPISPDNSFGDQFQDQMNMNQNQLQPFNMRNSINNMNPYQMNYPMNFSNQDIQNQFNNQPFNPRDFLPNIENDYIQYQTKSSIDLLNQKIELLNSKIESLNAKLDSIIYMLQFMLNQRRL